MTKSVLFLVPYPLKESPSQRFRFEQYFDLLHKYGYQFDVQSFLNSHNWQIFFGTGRRSLKLIALISGFLKRIIILFKVTRYDFVFIHRELTPIGPPIFEWIITKILKRKVIYDFDDAIWTTDRIEESKILRFLKYRKKVRLICSWSWKVSAGNSYLCSYAKQFTSSVILNPTTIDTLNWHNPDLFEGFKPVGKITIGWTGSHSTLKYLNDIEPILQALENEFEDLQFVVIADKMPPLLLRSIIFVPWKVETEIHDLMKFDIGLMPLPDDPWSNGKCGFKLLQYMALGIPAVASPVGVNRSIISDGENGFICSSPSEWKQAIIKLIRDPGLRKAMGERGRKKVIEDYSVISNSSNFVSLFE